MTLYDKLIIDRDAEGEGTVHFLNQVDEADLFHLLDEKAQEEYIQQITKTEEPEIDESEPESETETEPELELESEPEKKPGNMIRKYTFLLKGKGRVEIDEKSCKNRRWQVASDK